MYNPYFWRLITTQWADAWEQRLKLTKLEQVMYRRLRKSLVLENHARCDRKWRAKRAMESTD